MIRNFENNIVLTSQNPEAYLVFQSEGEVGTIDVSLNLNEDNLYVNGWDTTTISAADGSAALILDTTNIASFHLFAGTCEDFDYNLRFLIDASDVITLDVSVYNRPFLLDAEEFNTFKSNTALVDNEASYLLLRSNPKYSGNIKLRLDPSDNMFLDTFKVSDILSNKKYRRQKVSGNSFLSGDIRRVFETLPIGEVFRLDDETSLDIANPKTEYYDQYNTTYNYGAKILVDELYDEDYAILAPLWINSKLPDYFVVFRLDGTFNEETYETSVDLSNLAKKFITEGDLIEDWNLKENVPAGKYLHNHLSELLKVESPVNLSLNEYDPNTWNGEAIDKGIITGRSEVPYFFQKTTHNFTDTNAFVSEGFERQNLLMPNLINMEFVFNDYDVSLYTMHRYFGLYLTENELYKVAYYSDEPDSSVNIISLDGKDILEFVDSSIFNPTTGNVEEDYENRLFVINDNVELKRVCCSEQFDGTKNEIEEYLNKLGKNIFNTEVLQKFPNTFVSLRINNILKQGEHLRVINKTKNIIWEAFATESGIYGPGEAGPYVSYNEPSAGYPDLYRTSFSVLGNISDQAEAIRKAFTMFSDFEIRAPFSVGFSKDDGLSLVINDENDNDEYLFQRLSAQIAYNIGDLNSTFSTNANPEDISFYGMLTPDSSDYIRIPWDASYGPIDFELYGDRMSTIVNMVNVGSSFVYSFDASVSELFTENVLYDAADGWNRLIQNFDVSTGISYKYQFIEDPLSGENKFIIVTEKEINIDTDNIWWAYDVYPISVSLMGINPVKDFDFTVYDSSTTGMDFKSNYQKGREGDELSYSDFIGVSELKTISERNSYEIVQGQGTVTIDGSILTYSAVESSPSTKFGFNTFFGDAEIYATSPTTIKYNVLDGSHNYSSYDSSVSEENINDYYLDSTKTKLKYGLVIPTVSKWGLNGQDVRNNNVRLNLTNYLFDDPSAENSNFIPFNDSSLYADEISYPIFKYMYTGNDAWKDYVYYDINDIVADGSSRTSVRHLIFEDPYSDIFSKLLYNNNGVSGSSTRSSILYYNLYENQVISIIKGLKLGLKVTPTGEQTLNVTNWDRYRFSMISSPTINTAHNYPIEVIINENTETILMIWYQGNDVLNYNYKWSSFLPGKSNLINQHSTGVDKNFESFYTKNNGSDYSFIKSPFIVNTASVTSKTYNMYDTSISYDSSICTPFNQFSYGTISNINTVFNANSVVLGNNKVDNNIFSFSQSYDTFNQAYVDYTYGVDSISFGIDISNIASNYLNNYNFYSENTCNYDTFKYLIEENNIQYYILQEENILTSQLFSSQPVKINIFDPIEYKSPGSDSSIYTFNGGYTPIFNNILVFEDNESNDLINVVEKDFVFSNTNLQSYENIYQYWFNKVVETVTTSDDSNNILFTENFNPFKSQWDADYYVLSDGGIKTNINGFNSSLELPAMFGSKLIALPDELILEIWNASNSKVIEEVDYYSLEFNLTKTILDLFTNNTTFIQNWGLLSGVTDDIINRYIIKTILNYYNISIDKIKPIVYDKKYDGTILHSIYDNSFKNQIINIDSQLSFLNNEYIYKIKFGKTNDRSYFTKFVFNKK